MSKVSISTFLILGVYLLFMSIMSLQITNAQEEVRKMNPHQKEALQLFSKSPLEQQQLEPTNDEAALKTLIQPKFQQNQQQQQEKIIEQNNKQLVPFELFFNVQPAQSAGKVKSQQIEQELLQKLEQEKQRLEQKLQEQQKNQGVSNNGNQIVNPSNTRNIQAQSEHQQQQQEPTNDEAALKTLILQKLQIMQQEKKQQQLQQETNENDIQIVNPSNAKKIKSQNLQQQQQQQQADEEQNIKALELFFNTDTQQQQEQKKLQNNQMKIINSK
jgi:hypothetical protein